MKKILLMTTKYGSSSKDRWLTNELCLSLKSKGYDVSALVLSWLPSDEGSGYKEEEGIKVLRYKLPDFFYKNNIIIKAIKMMIFPILVKKSIKKHFENIKFDLVISNTPCITLKGLTKYFKKKDNALNYLVLWDFFPYYLLDLGILKNNIKFKLLKEVEKKMFKTYDKIGCMTDKNISFLKEKYNYTYNNVEILPLWSEIKPKLKIDRKKIREKYNFKEEEVILVYGGAMSVVQKLENIISLAERLENKNHVKFLMIGKGTEKEKIKEIVNFKKLKNVIFLEYIPREEYELLISACDIGIVSLSEKLSVPSFPSKSIDYCKIGIPILAAIDSYTDYGEILEKKMKCGKAAIANNTEELYLKALEMISNESYRIELGKKGREYYENEFHIDNAVNTIEKVFNF